MVELEIHIIDASCYTPTHYFHTTASAIKTGYYHICKYFDYSLFVSKIKDIRLFK